jgi:23S rRNA (pseudouridine1915-N3)-methyltransferase
MIKIICIGKIKENYLKEAIIEYKKRISKYTNIEIIELDDYNYDIKKTLLTEYNSIIKVMNNSDYNILLDINGNELDSVSFAKKINDTLTINSNITFIIGGSYGVLDELRNKVDYKLSFSKLTFPHQLFRVLLLEQIYRAYKINNHEEYHK